VIGSATSSRSWWVALLGATLTGWNWIQRNKLSDAVWTGLLVGLASAFKPTAIVVLLPIIAIAIWTHRSVRPILGAAITMGALAVLILPLSYLPVGTQAPRAPAPHDRLPTGATTRSGHLLVVDGKLTTHQPRYSHLLYQWRGMGWAACTGLLIGVIGAWTGRGHRLAIGFASAIWLSLLGFHLLSSVALPHYYLLWAPFSVLVAAMGLAELVDRGALPIGDAATAKGPNGIAAHWQRAAGPTAAVAVGRRAGSSVPVWRPPRRPPSSIPATTR